MLSPPCTSWTRPASPRPYAPGTRPGDVVFDPFAGSGFAENPEDPKKPIYLANQGDVICLANFNTATAATWPALTGQVFNSNSYFGFWNFR